MTIAKRIILVLAVLLSYPIVRSVTEYLRPRPAHEFAAAFPGAVTIGFYTAFVVTSTAAFLLHAFSRRSIASVLSRHSLLFVMISGFSWDYVLNNYQEIRPDDKDGSYGLVILIDFVIWTVATLMMTVYAPREGDDYRDSWIVLLVPIFPFLREIVYVKDVLHSGPALVDLAVQTALMIAWILLPYSFHEQARYRRTTMVTKFVMFVSLLYGTLLITENILSHFLSFGMGLGQLRGSLGGEFGVNVLFLGVAFTVAGALFAWNPRNLRLRFAGPCS